MNFSIKLVPLLIILNSLSAIAMENTNNIKERNCKKLEEQLIYSSPLLEEIKPRFIEESSEYHNQLIEQLTDSNEKIEHSPGFNVVYSPDLNKVVQIIYNSDAHPILQLVDTQTNLVRDLPLDQFKNSSKDPFIVWDKSPEIFWVKQENNSYIIFTDEKKPIYYCEGTKHIQFSPKNNFAILKNAAGISTLLDLKNKKHPPLNDFIRLISINLSENEHIEICLSPDERYAVIDRITSNKIVVYDLHENTPIFEQVDILDHKFSSASDCIYIVLKNELTYSLRIFDLKEKRIRNLDTSNDIIRKNVSPDGNYIIISPYEIYGLAKNMVIALDRDYQQATDVLRWLPGHDHAITVTLRDTKDSWGILDVETNSLITPLFTKVRTIQSFQSKKYLVIVYEKERVQIWDLKNNCPLLNLLCENIFTEDMKLAWSTDDKFLIHNSDSGKKPGKPYTSLLLFDCENKKYLLNLKADIKDFGFAQNSHIFFTQNDPFCKIIYNVNRFQKLISEL